MPDPVLETRSYVFLMSDPVLGTGLPSLFIYTGAGTKYKIMSSILFTRPVVGYQILFFDLVLDTGLNARSSIGYQT